MKPVGRYVRFDAVAGTTYQIQVIGADTQPFTVQLTATNSPVFIFGPKDCTVSPHGSAFFTALATGPLPPSGYPARSTTSYQWFFNGMPIPGQTFPSLLVHGVTTNNTGAYSVIASNVGGVTQGGSALLTIDTNHAPGLAISPATSPNSMNFALKGEPGPWYKIESSTNLQAWSNPFWLQLTNPAVPVSIQRLGPNHFVRASLDVPTEVCIAQLKQLQWAVSVWAIENQQPDAAPCYLENLKPYIPLNSGNSIPPCPEGGYYVVATVTNLPTCNRVRHMLPNSP